MKSLLLLRHAKSSWSQANLSDHDRPLNPRGQLAAPRMGQLLDDEGLLPDLILCSSAKRAQATAEKVVERSGYGGEVQICEDLYHAGSEVYFETLRALPDEVDRVLVIAHNPGLEELLDLLTGIAERMPTAALAHLALRVDTWGAFKKGIKAELLGFWRPRELMGE